MKVFSRVKLHHVALVLAATAVPQLVHAGTPDSEQEIATVHVDYSDLNLSSEAGKDALYYRISNASRAVCGVQNSLTGAGSLKQLMINQKCYDATMAKAFAEVKQASLANLNE